MILLKKNMISEIAIVFTKWNEIPMDAHLFSTIQSFFFNMRVEIHSICISYKFMLE